MIIHDGLFVFMRTVWSSNYHLTEVKYYYFKPWKQLFYTKTILVTPSALSIVKKACLFRFRINLTGYKWTLNFFRNTFLVYTVTSLLRSIYKTKNWLVLTPCQIQRDISSLQKLDKCLWYKIPICLFSALSKEGIAFTPSESRLKSFWEEKSLVSLRSMVTCCFRAFSVNEVQNSGRSWNR